MAVQSQMYPMSIRSMQNNMGSIKGIEQNWLLPLNGFTFEEIEDHNILLPQQKLSEQRQQCYIESCSNEIQRGSKRRLLAFDLTSMSTIINHNNHGADCNMSSVAALFAKQNRELDTYMELQNQRMRLTFQEQNKKQMISLLRKVESKAMLWLSQKDEEIAKANKRTIELHELVRKLEAENQVWKTVAMENEAMISALNTAIEQMNEKVAVCSLNNVADDAESCCSVVEQKNHIENGVGDEQIGSMCKKCNANNSSVLFLPCRHLCSCIECESLLDSCLICELPKQASIEIVFP